MEKAHAYLSRRNMLLAGSGLACAGALVALSGGNAITGGIDQILSGRGGAGSASLANANFPEWVRHVGTRFAVAGGATIRLAGVRALPSIGRRPPGVTRDRAFLAVFDVLGGHSLAGDLIYSIAHPQLGALPIFLSASTDPSNSSRMFAVFN